MGHGGGFGQSALDGIHLWIRLPDWLDSGKIQEMMTMTQAEREVQVKVLSDKAATLWKSMGDIMVEGARSGNVCVDLELLRQWQSEVFAIMAGIGPLEWPLPDEHERMKP